MKLPRQITIISIVLVISIAYWGFIEREAIMVFIQPEKIGMWIKDLGPMGPVATGALMAVAIIFSPIPSAPIALAAGAVYGHTWGTVYILIGAEIGALVAFALARVLGKRFVDRWVGDRLPNTFIVSQNGLTLLILTARLIPFLSFDVVSYAAGLTSISLLRFALATLAGMIPASFVLAHFGAELTAANTNQVLIAVLAMAVLMIVPIVIMKISKWRNNRKSNEKL